MSKKKPNEADQGKERIFLDRLAALSSGDDRDQSLLDEDLRDCGIDPAELRKGAHARMRRIADHNYLTLDKECPPKLRDFLRQMRPPKAEEEQQREKTQAASKIGDLLSSIRSGISSAFTLPAPQTENVASAFRNKKNKLTQKDRDLLESHQAEIDAESEDKNP